MLLYNYVWYFVTYLIECKAGEDMNQFINRLTSGIVKNTRKLFKLIIIWFKKSFNRREFFTLMIIPHAPVKSVRSVKFPKWIVSFFVIVNAAMFIVVCAFGISYNSLDRNLKDKKAEYQDLQAVKENGDIQLNKYKENEVQIKEKIQVLTDLESKLQDIIETKGEKPQSSSTLPKLASRGINGSLMTQSLSGPSSEIEFDSIEDMYITVDNLVKDVDSKVTELNAVILEAENKIKAARALPSVLPTYGNITTYFGYRRNPFGSGYEFHPAIDIANAKGTPIKASGDGVVIEAGYNSGGLGNLVTINHGNGYVSMYGHNSKLAVKVGQRVTRGQVIAYMGSTGRSTGSHCHFEVRYKGNPINPFNVK